MSGSTPSGPTPLPLPIVRPAMDTAGPNKDGVNYYARKVAKGHGKVRITVATDTPHTDSKPLPQKSLAATAESTGKISSRRDSRQPTPQRGCPRFPRLPIRIPYRPGQLIRIRPTMQIIRDSQVLVPARRPVGQCIDREIRGRLATTTCHVNRGSCFVAVRWRTDR